MPYEKSVPELTAVEGSVDGSAALVMLKLTPVVNGARRSPFWYCYCENCSAFPVNTAVQNLGRWDLCRTAFNFRRLCHISLALRPVFSHISGEAIL